MEGLRPPRRTDTETQPPERHIRVGKIVGLFGIKGWVKVEPLSDFKERFAPGASLWLKGRPHPVTHFAKYKEMLRIKLEGIDSPEEAQPFIGQYLTVPESNRPTLAEDEYLVSDLVGLRVVTTDGREVGAVEQVVPSPAADLLQIGDTLIPVIKQFVRDIDLAKGVITVELIPGMLPGERTEEVR